MCVFLTSPAGSSMSIALCLKGTQPSGWAQHIQTLPKLNCLTKLFNIFSIKKGPTTVFWRVGSKQCRSAYQWFRTWLDFTRYITHSDDSPALKICTALHGLRGALLHTEEVIQGKTSCRVVGVEAFRSQFNFKAPGPPTHSLTHISTED